MAEGGQISSLHVAIAAAGGVLLYAALRGVSPVAALKDITSGAPPAVSTEGKKITLPDGSIDPSYVSGGEGTTPWKGGSYKRNGKFPEALRKPVALVAAATITHSGEKYDRDRRWSKGYSDCSSFVGKCFLDIGIEPPGGSTTYDYMNTPDWVTVSDPQMGDLAVNVKHMAMFTDGQNGIGQQNKNKNVSRDTMDNLMANTGGGYEIYRYRKWIYG